MLMINTKWTLQEMHKKIMDIFLYFVLKPDEKKEEKKKDDKKADGKQADTTDANNDAMWADIAMSYGAGFPMMEGGQQEDLDKMFPLEKKKG